MQRPKRNIYLKLHTLDAATQLWARKTSSYRTSVGTAATHEALHRVAAQPVVALRSVPHYHGAAMDGFAVLARNTFGAGETRPVRLVKGVSAFAVDTGDPLPPGTDSVIMIEQVENVSGEEIEIRAAAFPWQHVRKVGEDIVAGELLLPRNHRLRPADLGALLAAGIVSLPVYAKPVVWIQPTGTELIAAHNAAEAAPGQIIEFNGLVLSALSDEYGAEAFVQGAVPDDYDSIRQAVLAGCSSSADIVLINAGSSAGSEDYTAAVIAELGEVLVHGVAMMPGKPTILGFVLGKPVVGIPGYPVSAILAFEHFVRPLLFSLQGLPCPAVPEVNAVLGRKTASRLGLEEFVRVVLGRVQGRLVAMPIQRGAGVITSLTRADGIVRIPQELEGFDSGAEVPVQLLRPPEHVEHTLIMIGSHDNSIDVIANELKLLDHRVHLSSSNVGSLGGLMAVRKGQAHLAGTHLLDTETGEYNFSYVERHLKGVPVRLVRLARRSQGLLVLPGNPKNIMGMPDLLRPDVVYINRQAGSGTRILLDYRLGQLGLSGEKIRGYEQEEFTHMAVAVNVLSGRADAGMAIYASARALGLDFVPVAEEFYDLAIPETSWNDHKIRMVLEIVASESFRKTLRELGGYDPEESGAVVGQWDGSRWLVRKDL